MKVLLIGGGGREDALAWAISRSPQLTSLTCIPGNAGIAARARCLDLPAGDIDALSAHAVEEGYELVVVGPEQPLVDGLADRLRDAGLAVFGPGAGAAVLEGSKVFSKRFMERHRIPTAPFEVFDDFEQARERLAAASYPRVVKADGLAAGKGVIIAQDAGEAIDAARRMLSGDAFGDAGRTILVEDCLTGREASFFVLADGEDFVELATCQDYKRARDGDEGPNTGGMGTYSPSAYLDDATRRLLIERVVRPTIEGLRREERPYHGVLYVGVMLTADGPQVLEYNVRFGDPECQVLMPRLDGDWLQLLHASATGKLGGVELRWKNEAAVCVVMTSGGYPGAYARGHSIEGVADAESDDGAVVFHAGTSRDGDGRLLNTGGRVLGVTALGADLGAARDRAYAAVRRIHWQDEYHRGDIALDAVGHEKESEHE